MTSLLEMVGMVQGVEDYESGKVGRDGHYKKMGKEKKEMAPLW